MSGFLTPDELRKLKPAETASFASPIPTQVVSSDEYYPAPQNEKQREVEARVKAWVRSWPASKASAAELSSPLRPEWLPHSSQ